MSEPCVYRGACLGHADERSTEVTCQRCAGSRWILVRPASAPEPDYTCTRCRAALAGHRVADPLGKMTPAQRLDQAERLRQIAMTRAKRSAPRPPNPGVKG